MTTTPNGIDLGHDDHGLDQPHLEFIDSVFEGKKGFFIDVFTMPEKCTDLLCALYGPSVGDEPITEDEINYKVRNGRAGTSRLVSRAHRPARNMVVCGIAGGQSPVIYTAYGTRANTPSPREWWDKGMLAACAEFGAPKATPAEQLASLKAGLDTVDIRDLGAVGAEAKELDKIRAAIIIAIESAKFWCDHALAR